MRKGLILVPLSVAGAYLGGCVDYNNRPPPSTTEIKQADVKRQAYIDTIPNQTPEQRAIMKSHMGGPPAPTMQGNSGGGTARPEGRAGG